MGCAIAYNLLKRDAQLKILIVERDSTYEKASTTLSDGNTRIQFNLKTNIEMSLYGLEVLATFAEEFATAEHVPDIAFRQQGNLYLVDEAGYDFARKGLAQQQSMGCDVVWLERGEIEQHYPLYKLADGVVGATFGRKDGTMSPRDVLLAYRRKTADLGATFLEAEVSQLLKANNQMTGIQLVSGEVYQSNIIFNVTGAWAPILARQIGVELPISPIKRQVYTVQIDRYIDGILPMFLLTNGQFVFHEGGTTYITGGALPDDPVTYSDFSWHQTRFEEQLWENLVAALPDFDRLRVTTGWAGLYAVNTFDHNAILGEWPTVQGYYCANGFSGHGFQQCHAVGRYLAEVVLGLPHELDLSVFAASRILENKPVFENPSRLI